MRWIQAAGLRVSVIDLGGWQLGTPAWGWGRDFGPAEARSIGAGLPNVCEPPGGEVAHEDRTDPVAAPASPR